MVPEVAPFPPPEPVEAGVGGKRDRKEREREMMCSIIEKGT